MKRLFPHWPYCAALLLVCGATMVNAQTQAQTSFAASHSHIELLASRSSVRAREPLWVAVRITPKRGWHSYWKNPGDAGLPATLAWSFPANTPSWKFGELLWPAPERIPVKRLASYGYSGAVLLPQQLFAPAVLATGQHTLKLRVDWLVCEESCIPQEAQLQLTLTAEPGAARADLAGLAANHSGQGADAKLIAQSLSAMPTAAQHITATAQRRAGKLHVTLAGLADARGELFIEQEEIVEPGSAPQTALNAGTPQWSAPLGAKGWALKAPAQLDAVWVPRGQKLLALRLNIKLTD